MKKRLTGLSILAGLTLLLAACGGGGDTSVYVVFDIGGRGDQSFNDSAAAGLDLATEELGVTSSELEPTAGGENRDDLLNLAAEDGAQLVFGVGFLFADSIAGVSAAYPDTNFALIDGFVPDLTADQQPGRSGLCRTRGFLPGRRRRRAEVQLTAGLVLSVVWRST